MTVTWMTDQLYWFEFLRSFEYKNHLKKEKNKLARMDTETSAGKILMIATS